MHSGGLDSHITWLATGYRPVYVRHGAEAEDAELHALSQLRHSVTGFFPIVVDGPDLSRLTEADGHVRHRNLVLIVTAAARTGADRIAYGALLGEGSPDKSRAFRRAASHALSASENRRVVVEAPLAKRTKTGALRWALSRWPDELRAALPILTACYHGTSCGQCQACYRRALAEWTAGIAPNPPPLPLETYGPLATVRANRWRRLPGMAAANVQSVRAALARRRAA